MDSERFDAMAKTLAAAASRRAALRTMAVSGLVAVLAGLGLETAAAACKKPGRKCDKNKNCCTNRCKTGRCRCGKAGQTCKRDAHCRGAQRCGENPVCGPGKACCRTLGSSCAADCACCADTRCVDGRCCFGGFQTCVNNARCCSGQCLIPNPSIPIGQCVGIQQ